MHPAVKYIHYYKALSSCKRHIFLSLAGSISQENFFKYHTVLHDIVKGKLASAKLPPIMESLCLEFNTQLDRLTDGKAYTWQLNEQI